MTIDNGAFGFCPSLKSIYIPETATNIDTPCLAGNSDENRIIYGKKGSFIEKEIQERGEELHITFEER